VAFCSIQRIEISDDEGNFAGHYLADFGDQMDDEVAISPNLLSQDSTAIDATEAIVHGRGNKSQTLTWSVTRTAASAIAARKAVFNEIAAIPGNTIAARVFYEDDLVTPAFISYRVRVEAYPGKPVSGLDYTINYSMVWQLGTSAGGGAPPPSDFGLLMNDGGRAMSSQGPQILMFH